MDYVYLGFVMTVIPLFFILVSGKFDLFSPASLHVLSWTILFFSGILVGNKFYPLNLDTFIIFLVWYIVAGLMFFVMYFSQNQNNNYIILKKYEIKYIKTLSLMVLICCFVTIFEIFKVGFGGPNHFFLNLRLSLFLEDYTGPRYVVTPVIYLFLTPLFAIALMCKNSKKLLFLLIFWQLLFVVSTMGKFSILTPLLIYMVIKYSGKKIKIKISRIFLLSGGVGLLFFLINMIRSSESSDSDNILAMVGSYTYSPLLALGQVQMCDDCSFGQYTFRFFYAICYKLGLSLQPPVNTVLDYAYVPFPTNVYTVIQPFYFDFGLYGVFYGALFYGTFYSLIYFKLKQEGSIFLVIYALFSVSLLSSFLGETLLTNFALTLYLIGIALLFWKGLVIEKR